MSTCSKCGDANPEDATFCAHCGAELQDSPAPPAEHSRPSLELDVCMSLIAAVIMVDGGIIAGLNQSLAWARSLPLILAAVGIVFGLVEAVRIRRYAICIPLAALMAAIPILVSRLFYPRAEAVTYAIAAAGVSAVIALVACALASARRRRLSAGEMPARLSPLVAVGMYLLVALIIVVSAIYLGPPASQELKGWVWTEREAPSAVFVAKEGDRWAIHCLDRDGGRTRIASGFADPVDPSLSPDGRWACWSAKGSTPGTSDRKRLFVCPSAIARPRKVGDLEPTGDVGAVWSPDNRWLVLEARARAGDKKSIWLVDRTAVYEPVRLLEGPMTLCVWSPDSRYLVLNVGDEPKVKYLLVNRSTGSQETIADGSNLDVQALWSPDSKVLAMAVFDRVGDDAGKFTLIYPAEDRQEQIPCPSGRAIIESPTWSPSGKHLAFAMSEVTESTADYMNYYTLGAYVVASSGGKPTRVVNGQDTTGFWDISWLSGPERVILEDEKGYLIAGVGKGQKGGRALSGTDEQIFGTVLKSRSGLVVAISSGQVPKTRVEFRRVGKIGHSDSIFRAAAQVPTHLKTDKPDNGSVGYYAADKGETGKFSLIVDEPGRPYVNQSDHEQGNVRTWAAYLSPTGSQMVIARRVRQEVYDLYSLTDKGKDAKRLARNIQLPEAVWSADGKQMLWLSKARTAKTGVMSSFDASTGRVARVAEKVSLIVIPGNLRVPGG